MILTTTVYGIPLTDEFGGPLKNRKSIHKAVLSYLEKEGENLYDDDNYDWFVSFPSAEDQQVVLGVSTDTPQRDTDWKALDKMFNDAVLQAPKNIQALIKNIEPKIVFLAGHC